jgi:thioredoxin-dependent peroxiredoxin
MLKPGDLAPDFTLPAPTGRPFELAGLRGVKNAVIFFYPRDSTYVCTREACAFRDRYEEFVAAGAVVIGVSDDDAASHVRFAERYDLPYTLLTDVGGLVRNAYGVTGLLGLLKGRATFVIDREGAIIHIVRDRFNAQAHVDEALATLQAQRRS